MTVPWHNRSLEQRWRYCNVIPSSTPRGYTVSRHSSWRSNYKASGSHSHLGGQALCSYRWSNFRGLLRPYAVPFLNNRALLYFTTTVSPLPNASFLNNKTVKAICILQTKRLLEITGGCLQQFYLFIFFKGVFKERGPWIPFSNPEWKAFPLLPSSSLLMFF